MKFRRIFFFVSILLVADDSFAQTAKNIYPLNAMDSLLTKKVEDVLDKNLIDKRVVFLGESFHEFESDFLAKAQFVRYLVLEKGYRDIAFESDFFALYFDHNPQNLYSFWQNSKGCKALFKFLKDHQVTIWGIDNQLYSKYSMQNFSAKLAEFLKENSIPTGTDFYALLAAFLSNPYKFDKKTLLLETPDLLKNEKIVESLFWTTALESLKSYVVEMENPTEKSTGSVRDHQMAKNLDFLVKTMPNKKMIVWLHNAHMSKDAYTFVPGQNMGADFIHLNPKISYHIAFSDMHTIFRNSKKIEKDSRDDNNLLHFLPNTSSNYFMDAKAIIEENPSMALKKYDGLFDMTSNKTKTNWLGHYDALVFIANGELITNQ